MLPHKYEWTDMGCGKVDVGKGEEREANINNHIPLRIFVFVFLFAPKCGSLCLPVYLFCVHTIVIRDPCFRTHRSILMAVVVVFV